MDHPTGVPNRDRERHPHQQIAPLEDGQEVLSLAQQAKAASIERCDFLSAGDVEKAAGIRLERARQGAALSLPPSRYPTKEQREGVGSLNLHPGAFGNQVSLHAETH